MGTTLMFELSNLSHNFAQKSIQKNYFKMVQEYRKKLNKGKKEITMETIHYTQNQNINQWKYYLFYNNEVYK